MRSSPQYPTLARLLALNNQVHDLENRLLGVAVPDGRYKPAPAIDAPASNSIAALQEEIDQGARASLATCWLGIPEDDGE